MTKTAFPQVAARSSSNHSISTRSIVRRVPTLAVALGSALLATAGCALLGQDHEVTFEVTGAGGPAGQVEYWIPGDRDAHTVKNVALPWKTETTTEFGIMTVKATPTKGALTCRILADGREITKVVGKEGEQIVCSKIVNDE